MIAHKTGSLKRRKAGFEDEGEDRETSDSLFLRTSQTRELGSQTRLM
jgi:hypothetical protein